MTARRNNTSPQASPPKPQQPLPTVSKQESLGACIVRGTWLLGGNMLLFVVGLLLLFERPWTITAKDAIFCASVALVVVTRYVDITRLDGRTADGERATIGHFRRHAIATLGASAVLWVIAQSVQILGPAQQG